MEQIPTLDAFSLIANQEISCILWKTEDHYRVQNSPRLVPVLRQTKIFEESILFLKPFDYHFSFYP